MEVRPTGRRFKRKAPALFIERVSAGRLYERVGRCYCRRQGYTLLRTHYFLGHLEIDLLGREGSSLIVIEVRGRRQDSYRFRPVWSLSQNKKRCLQRAAQQLARRHHGSVRVELLEVIGKLPRTKWGRWVGHYLLPWFPEWFGLRLQSYLLDI